MLINVDQITQRKLIIIKQLYLQALENIRSINNYANNIFAVIGFDLAIETLLYTIVFVLDNKKTPSDQFMGLVNQCEKLLNDRGISSIPNKSNIIHIHSVRNDAQHKAKFPTENEANDCRTYSRDICEILIKLVWDISFEEISLIEIITDNEFKLLFKSAISEIEASNYKKGISIIGVVFFCASRTILNYLPTNPLYVIDNKFSDSRDIIERLKISMQLTNDNALFYSILFSSGITPAEYKRFLEITPKTDFRQVLIQGQIESRSSDKIYFTWGDKQPIEQDAYWIYNFVINSIVNWQYQGLIPSVTDKWKMYIQALRNWDNDIIME